MSVIFEIVDKTARRIRLTRKQWAHIQKHDGLSGKTEQIQDALVQPDALCAFEYDESVWFYYKYDKIRKDYLLVSVKYLNGHGFIITSFYTDAIK